MGTLEEHQNHVAEFERHANTDTPYVIRLDSGVEGPELVFGGGVHGNESGGVEAALALRAAVEEGTIKLTRGAINLVLGNPQAYAQGKRFLDENLNRLFAPHLMKDNIEGRRAREIFDYIKGLKERLAAVIDFHSVSTSDTRILVFNRSHAHNEKMVDQLPRMFHMYFAFVKEHLEGILSDVGTMMDADGFSVECGIHGGAHSAEVALRTMKIALDRYHLGWEGEFPSLLPEFDPHVPNPVRYETLKHIVPAPGFAFLDENVVTGTKVRSGEVYARADAGDYIAERDCTIVMPTRKPAANDHDAGFLCQEVDIAA